MIRPEQSACAAAAVLATASLLGFRPRLGEAAASGPEVRAERAVTSSIAGDDGVLTVPPSPSAWRDHRSPSATLAGFDLFTPPLASFDHAEGRLHVTRPARRTTEAATDFGVDLVEIVHEPFRLQLVGYAGDETDCVGVFENRISGRTFLARAPLDVPELGLQIRSLAVKRQVVTVAGAMPLAQRAAEAIVQDLQTGERIVLSSHAPPASGPARARLRDSLSREVREALCGTEWVLGSAKYRIEAIETDPPRVQIVRASPESPDETRWLQPTP